MKIQVVFFCLFLLLFTPISSTSQSNFRPGFITLLDGTTAQGVIRINNWDTTPIRIAFKSTLGAPSKSYSPNELLGFKAEGYIYKSALVNIEASPAGLKFLDNSSTLNIVSRHIFLQQILGGEKPLYLNRSQLGKENFYLEDQGQFVLLEHKQYKQEFRSGSDQLRINRAYIVQLADILRSCPSLSQTITQTSYTKKGLVKLLRSYASCAGSTIEYEIKKRKVPITYGLLAGVAYSHLAFEGLNVGVLNDFHEAFPTGNTIDPTAGAFINIVLPFDQKKWSIHNEVLITSLQREGT